MQCTGKTRESTGLGAKGGGRGRHKKKETTKGFYSRNVFHEHLMVSQAVLKIVNNLVPYYVSGTLLYGFVRSVTYDFEAKERYWNERQRSYETKDMLFVDTLGRIASKTLSAVVMWPVMLGEDFACLECAMYKKDPDEYGIKRI